MVQWLNRRNLVVEREGGREGMIKEPCRSSARPASQGSPWQAGQRVGMRSGIVILRSLCHQETMVLMMAVKGQRGRGVWNGTAKLVETIKERKSGTIRGSLGKDMVARTSCLGETNVFIHYLATEPFLLGYLMDSWL